MSTATARMQAPRVAVALETTEEVLGRLGYSPDQKRARCMMEAGLLGLDPNRAHWSKNLITRMLSGGQVREQFAYDKYAATAPLWEVYGEVPDTIKSAVARIRAALPNARVVVHTARSDPWITVDELVVFGWDSRGSYLI